MATGFRLLKLADNFLAGGQRHDRVSPLLLSFQTFLTCHSFIIPAIFSSSGLLWQHCVSRRADSKQPGCPIAPERGKDFGDKPPADRPCRGAIRLLQYTRWPWGGTSPMESPQFPGEWKYIIFLHYCIYCNNVLRKGHQISLQKGMWGKEQFLWLFTIPVRQ